MSDDRAASRHIHLKDYEPVSSALLSTLPSSVVRKNRVVPLIKRDGRLLAAVASTDNTIKAEGLTIVAGCPVDLVFAPIEEIISFIQAHYPEAAVEAGAKKSAEPKKPEASTSAPALPARPAPQAACPPLLRELITNARLNRGTQILVEHDRKKVRVRQRIRGVLITTHENAWPTSAIDAVIAALSQLSKPDTLNGVRGLDFRMDVAVGSETLSCGLVVSVTEEKTLLTVHIAPVGDGAYSPEAWGMGPQQARTLEVFLSNRQGVILFCGLDSDGVAENLRSCARSLATAERHVVAVESYFEEAFPCGTHLVGNGDADVFTRLLKQAFRHSPDVVLANSVTTREQAALCFSESLQGRLLLTRCAARDSSDALVQLVLMGLEPHVIGSALIGVVAQRRLRLLCPKCQEKEPLTRDRVKELGIPVPMQPSAFYTGKGCASCMKSGFDRDTFIFELLPLTDELRHQLHPDLKIQTVRAALKSSGALTLRQTAVHKAINGQTSLSEVLRITS